MSIFKCSEARRRSQLTPFDLDLVEYDAVGNLNDYVYFWLQKMMSLARTHTAEKKVAQTTSGSQCLLKASWLHSQLYLALSNFHLSERERERKRERVE